MTKLNKSFCFLNCFIIILLFIVTILGICSLKTGNDYFVTNQFGENIRMWGSGLYKHDSFFRATTFIGTDITILFVLVPLIFISFYKLNKNPTIENYIQNLSTIATSLYYSTCLSFGVSYNYLHLIYILLFSSTLFCTLGLFIKIYHENPNLALPQNLQLTKVLFLFLLISGISLFVAWLPDIIFSLVQNRSLELIEIYTTEITYVLDMGIISPLIFISIYLSKKNNFIGFVLIRMVLRICIIVGIMVILQTAVQMYAGIIIPIPAMITKVLIFIVLSIFAFFFERRLKFC